MCRTHEISYLSCDHTLHNDAYTFRCPSNPVCSSPQINTLSIPYFCPSCLLSPNLPRNASDHNYDATDSELAHAKAIFARAAPLGTSSVTWTNNPDVGPYTYHTLDLSLFSEPLSIPDGQLIKKIEYVMYGILWAKLLSGGASEPTQNELILYIQFHNAAMGTRVRDAERRLNDNPIDQDAEIVRRLNRILTPVPAVLADNTECPICREVLGQPTADAAAERPVKLPCGHVYGRTCLETWVKGFVPGNHFQVCTMCGKAFELLTDSEMTGGIGTQDPGPRPLWMDIFRNLWMQGV